MTRRTALKGAVASLAGIPQARAADRGRQPNVLFILADDLGYADVSCYGARDYETPAIDALAATGTKLTQGYANSPVCSPSRIALATGCYPHRFKLGLEEPLSPRLKTLSLPSGQPTIATYFRNAGYRTGLIGKWHVGALPANSPLDFGYDFFLGPMHGGADYFSHRIAVKGNDPADGLYLGRQRVKRSGYLTDVFADEAIRFVREPTVRPFFLSLHFTAPHWPWEGPGDADRSREITNIIDLDGGSLKTYMAMMTALDAAIGRVLGALDDLDITRDTIVVFTSDNGGERFSDMWPLTGVKGELLEGGIRVPLVVRWPGRIPAGATSEQVMASFDFLPTLSAATRRPATEQGYLGDGIDLLPILTGERGPVDRTLFWRYKTANQIAARVGKWKYLHIEEREYLFDLENDPRERVQLRHKHSATFNSIRGMCAEWDKSMLPYSDSNYSENVKDIYPDRY